MTQADLEDVCVQRLGSAGSRAALIASQTLRRRPRAIAKLQPPPGAVLGRLLCLEVVEPSGRLVAHEWSPQGAPPLWWSDELRCAIAVPRARQAPSRPRAAEAVAQRAAARWNSRWGAGVRGRVTMPIPPCVLRPQGAAIRIIYRSAFGKNDDWQHPFGAHVWCFVGPGAPPRIIVVRGGNLRMTRRGLEG